MRICRIKELNERICVNRFPFIVIAPWKFKCGWGWFYLDGTHVQWHDFDQQSSAMIVCPPKEHFSSKLSYIYIHEFDDGFALWVA